MPGLLLVCLVAASALAALLLFVAVPGHEPSTSGRYADVLLAGSPGSLRLGVLFALAAVSLMVAGLTAWLAGDAVLALLAFATAGIWLAPELAGWEQGPPIVRNLGFLAAPMIVPLSAWVPIRALGPRLGPLARSLLVSVTLVMGCLALVRALTYDPFFDLACVAHCDYGILAWARDIRVARLASSLLTVVGLALAVSTATWAAVRLARLVAADRRRQGWLLGATVAVGSSTALWAAVRVQAPHELSADPMFVVPAVLTALSFACLGAAICERVMQLLRRRSAVRRIADWVEDEAASGGGMTRVLARTLGDARVAVAYPTLDGAGFVDELGLAVDEPVPAGNRSVTTVERGGVRIAIIRHDADIGSQLLSREIGAAARLTVENARLMALVRARVRELRESRARIVDAGDRARQALERDLHDGAQQRSLAVSFELRLARDAAAMAGAKPAEVATYDLAIEQVDQALTELRELARGIHPVVLTDEGLQSALVSLADRASTILGVTGHWACGDETTAIAAYQVVAEAVSRAEVAGAPRVAIDLQRTSAGITVVVTSTDLGDASWLHAEDRVGAAGGTLRVDTVEGRAVRVEVELPCA